MKTILFIFYATNYYYTATVHDWYQRKWNLTRMNKDNNEAIVY